MDDVSMNLPFHNESKVEPLRNGLASARAIPSNAAVHPVQALEKRFAKNDKEFKRLALANVFGSHFPLEQQLEEGILRGIHRLPPLHSEFVGLSTLLDTDEDITFEDFLNDPRDSEYGVDLHLVMEERLGL